MSKKTVLITGCSSGFGKLAVKKFHREGWNVVATMRSPEKETELTSLDNVRVTKLDVTDVDSIKNTIGQSVEAFGTIDVLVNNAGYGGHALFEQFSRESIQAMYDTNVFGLMDVCREVLPIMRKQKEGTIINITSVVGFLGSPTSSIYSSTKFAVEGLSEAMALEYKPLNIRVKTIAPGAFGTNFTAACDNGNTTSGDDNLTEYTKKLTQHIEAVVQQMRMQGGKDSDPREVADKIFECATRDTPIHNVVGADAEMFLEMKNSMAHQDFLDKVAEMALPKF